MVMIGRLHVNILSIKKCPICNGYSNIDIKNTIFTDIDCVICMEGEKKKVVFENCGHAQVCEGCVVQL